MRGANAQASFTAKEWEQALIDAYYDYRWRHVLQLLYDDFQRWAAGELTPANGHCCIEVARASPLLS